MSGVRMRRRSGGHRAGGGGGGGFTNTDTSPPALGGGSGLRLYCAAHHGLYTDAGTTLATATSDPIYRWKDYSGNNYHGDQATLGARPLAGAGAQPIFSHPRYLAFPGAVNSGVTDGELFVLVKLDAVPQSGTSAGGLWFFGGNDVGEFGTASGIREGAGTTSRYTFSAPAGLTSWHVYSVRTSGTDWDALLDNTPISGAARTGNTPNWGSPFDSALGTTFGNTLYLFGQAAAIAFYGGARSSGERSSIVTALLAQAPP